MLKVMLIVMSVQVDLTPEFEYVYLPDMETCKQIEEVTNTMEGDWTYNGSEKKVPFFTKTRCVELKTPINSASNQSSTSNYSSDSATDSDSNTASNSSPSFDYKYSD